MGIHFTSSRQERLFHRVLQSMEHLGYTGNLLRENYQFADYFAPNTRSLSAPAVGFARFPYDSAAACCVVVLANGLSGSEFISDFRSLGAPLALEVRDNDVREWRVSAIPKDSDLLATIAPRQLDAVFRDNASQWNPEAILRSKELRATKGRQLDFIDAGLMPALEQHVRAKLDPLLRQIFSEAKRRYEIDRKESPDFDELVRLVFRVITGKAMHDKGVEPFASLPSPPKASLILKMIAEHYDDSHNVLSDRDTQQFVIDSLWRGMSFANLSVESLALVWESTLVNDALRDLKGIHSTPPAVARYLTTRLIDSVPSTPALIVEPCCGTGTFLVSAIHRLRTLLAASISPNARHDIFVQSLIGFDTEEFGLEIARSCLTLADFPNPNGWNLRNVDVFDSASDSDELQNVLNHARFVLCNPPFEDFTTEEQDQYSPEFIQKPVELLSRVLDWLHPDGEIGFVLPYQAIAGKSYRTLRSRLAERFAAIEVVHLPEGVFQFATYPSMILICKSPLLLHNAVSVTFSSVDDIHSFMNEGMVDFSVVENKTVAQCATSLKGCELQTLWDRLEGGQTLATSSEDIARGVEWDGFDRAKHISDKPLRGFIPGFDTTEGMACFEAPPVSYLCAAKEYRRRNAWNKNWRLPKVICNAVRKSSGPWKLCACPVTLNLLCTQNFTVIWPKAPWTASSIAAVLNGPIASAYADCHEPWKHIKKETYKAIPFPDFHEAEIAELDDLVAEYESLVLAHRDNGSIGGMYLDKYPIDELLRAKLLAIDRFVFHGYHTSDDERVAVIDYFGSSKRQVPFEYTIETMFSDAPSSIPDHVGDDAKWHNVRETLSKHRL